MQKFPGKEHLNPQIFQMTRSKRPKGNGPIWFFRMTSTRGSGIWVKFGEYSGVLQQLDDFSVQANKNGVPCKAQRGNHVVAGCPLVLVNQL